MLETLSIAMYLYVGVAAYRSESLASQTTGMALLKAATWPMTIWNTIHKLYRFR